MAEFVRDTQVDGGKPRFAYVEMEIPLARHITVVDGERVEGFLKNERIYCPIASKDSLGHFSDLVHKKKYKLISFDLKGAFDAKVSEKLTKALKELQAVRYELEVAETEAEAEPEAKPKAAKPKG